MKRRRGWCFQLLLLLSFFLISSSFDASFSTNSTSPAGSLDSVIRDHAFKALARRRTGLVYKVPLPANLSGRVQAAVVRMRSRTLWIKGVNISSFRIPPRTVSMPRVRRLAIVYQNLGNWSSYYYNVHGYSLAAPVVGLLAYDSYNTSSDIITELDFKVNGDPISVTFSQAKLPKGLNSTKVKCASFSLRGSVHLDDMVTSNRCSTTNAGHFAIVFPLEEVSIPPPAAMDKGKERKWLVWVIACGGGVVGLVILGLVGVGIAKLVKKKRVEEMGRQAEEGEALETVWVGSSRMPSAAMVRTRPVLENGSAP